MRRLGGLERFGGSRISIIKTQLGEVWLDVILPCDYLVGRYLEIFPRQTGMLEHMADMVKAILLTDPDEIADNALIGLPMGSN